MPWARCQDSWEMTTSWSWHDPESSEEVFTRRLPTWQQMDRFSSLDPTETTMTSNSLSGSAKNILSPCLNVISSKGLSASLYLTATHNLTPPPASNSIAVIAAGQWGACSACYMANFYYFDLSWCKGLTGAHTCNDSKLLDNLINKYVLDHFALSPKLPILKGGSWGHKCSAYLHSVSSWRIHQIWRQLEFLGLCFEDMCPFFPVVTATLHNNQLCHSCHDHVMILQCPSS